jgi:hypothetical protein
MSTGGGPIQHKFKIGEILYYHRRGRDYGVAGLCVVLAIIPQAPGGDARYRIRSQNNRSLEYVAREDELKPIKRTHRRVGGRDRPLSNKLK